MESIALTRSSKEELMERITTRCAEELKSYKAIGGIFLILFLYNIIDFFWSQSSGQWQYALVPLAFMIEFTIEGWWSNRLSKSDNAVTLVATYEKYLKYEKVHSIVAIVVGVLLAGHLLILNNIKSTWVVWFCLALFCGLIVWILYRMKNMDKSITAQEVNRLRELIGN